MTAIDMIRPAKSYANFLHKVVLWLTPKPATATGPMPKTDKFARDAGLLPYERELLQLQWPSQTTRHPML